MNANTPGSSPAPDAMGSAGQHLATIQGQIDASRDLSASLSYDT